jgi:hypothetical protein
MRRITTIILSVLSTLIGNFSNAQANRPGEVMLSLGAGYSNLSTTVSTAPEQVMEIPEISCTLEYFALSNYAIGLSTSYQTISENGSYYSNGNPTIKNYTEDISRFTIALRPTFYFSKTSTTNFYAGIQIGFEYWYYKYPQGNPNQNSYGTGNYSYNFTVPSEYSPILQAFVGVRAQVTKVFSTYAELGTGLPFWGEIGVSIGFGDNRNAPFSGNSGIGEYGTPPPANH